MPTTFCRHIRTNGRRCCSPALRDKPYCYHHDRAHAHQRILNPRPPEGIPETVIHSMQHDPDWMQRQPLIAEYYGLKPRGPVTLDFPQLEDRESIQVALSMLLTALAHDRIDKKTAGLLLYGLQVASSNAKGISNEREKDAVTDLIVDEQGNELSLDEDPEEMVRLAEYLREFGDDEEDEEDDEYEDEGEDEDDEEEQADNHRVDVQAGEEASWRQPTPAIPSSSPSHAESPATGRSSPEYAHSS